MNLEIKKVLVEEKEILRNLLEKYLYEFSQWDGCSVNSLGLYGYPYLDYYWTEKNRYAFFLIADGELAGFVMVNDYPEMKEENDYTLAEFFVMNKFRRHGIGKKAAFAVFDMFHGRWQLMRHPNNLASVYFWDSVVEEYTKGNYRIVKNCQDCKYHDGTHGDVLLFEN